MDIKTAMQVCNLCHCPECGKLIKLINVGEHPSLRKLLDEEREIEKETKEKQIGSDSIAP